MGKRRLREVEPLRCPTEMQLVAHRKEVAEVTEIDRARNRRDKSLAAFRELVYGQVCTYATRRTLSQADANGQSR
jgi:hypothetical protein